MSSPAVPLYTYSPLAQEFAGEADPESLPPDPVAPRERRGVGWWLTVLGAFAAGAALSLLVPHTWSSSTAPRSILSDNTLSSLNDTTPTSPERLASEIAPVRLHYVGEPSLNEQEILFDCPITVIYTKDEVSADAVIYNGDKHDGGTLDHLEAKRARPWQRRVIWGSESESNRYVLYKHFEALREGRLNETFDYDMTYRLNGTVPGVYAYDYMQFGSQPLPFEQKRQDRLAAAFISNCSPKNARNLVLDELMTLLPGQIDSFGSCRRNADAESVLKELGRWEVVGQSKSRWNIKITTLASNKFSIAMENSNSLDYVTEKSFQPFEFGSVPIHLGSPSFNHSFQPGPNTAIDLADYLPPSFLNLTRPSDNAPAELSLAAKEGVARLADRLRYLGSEEGRQDYEKMLEWKKDDRWMTETPLGQVVKLGRMPLSRDCRLAGVMRGEAWGQSGYIRNLTERL